MGMCAEADIRCCTPYCWTDMDCPFGGLCNYNVWDAISTHLAPNLAEYGKWGICASLP
jgi:hypothetical protein